MAVEKARDRAGVGDDPGDVGGGGKGPDPHRSLGELDQARFKVFEVYMAVCVLVDLDHSGNGLTPTELVGMMLVWTDEDHRPVLLGDVRAESETIIEGCGNSNPEDRDQPVDRAGATGAGEDDGVVLIAPNPLTNQ